MSGSSGSSGASDILERLRRLRAGDAPTHGGRVLSYVYDSGREELDELADAAARLARPLNGLDPTVFPSIAAMERDLVAFTRRMLHGGRSVVGSVTSGGTESCLLAVKTARDLWRREHPEGGRPRLLTATTVHAAFQKAALLFDLDWDPVPCGADGAVHAADLIARMGDDVALVVVSAPAYPSGALDPIPAVARAAAERGISCHVDACFGGFVLPWWPELPHWDFRVRGVTSISADVHKFGYAPKGVSVLLHGGSGHEGRRRHRTQFFATTRWSGYPVVNPTLLGSRSASPLAAAWAITQHLGDRGYAELTGAIRRVALALMAAVDGIRGLTVMGEPAGPAIAVIADPSVPKPEQVDPHRLADALIGYGWKIQHQPGMTQSDGVRIPHSAHLTVTPVLEQRISEFTDALRSASDSVRGRPRADARMLMAGMRTLGYGEGGRVPGPEAAWRLLRMAGAAKMSGEQPMARLMALIELLPHPVAEALLTELLARTSEPH
ncbi:pyridoxal phosphate-dependent decarboxylase family protein [Microbacterium suwonense]|uniref:Aspartate aminotransferase family protein n=1 Tax=Microbacterium suwonense TaxID=683047 RepID=A0ABN6X6X9_9MICO|nr:aminotransferase class V-fold PLP-dependent enzyme [Microbacterium suwonense]BDZ39136.1 aspartate aminotransferase family protein [Microbacterium suwonense]